MNPLAFAVCALVVGAALCVCLWIWNHRFDEADMGVDLGNDYRWELARRNGMMVYSHEDYDGSLSWRRVTAD